jgi:hypothetical protein
MLFACYLPQQSQRNKALNFRDSLGHGIFWKALLLNVVFRAVEVAGFLKLFRVVAWKRGKGSKRGGLETL